MCNVCCKEFKGWCKSFTRIEACLTILEAVLLAVVVSFLIFVIVHFMVCLKEQEEEKSVQADRIPLIPTTISRVEKKPATWPSGIECTWKPSEKTTAASHYYLSDGTWVTPATEEFTQSYPISADIESPELTATFDEDKLSSTYEYEDVFLEESDGEYAEDTYNKYVLALVKLKPPNDLTFGCIVTIIKKHWALTAASCIEAIEEVDTLDSFFMIEGYGEARQGRSHALSDVWIHPLYQGVNRSYDLAALRSDDALLRGHRAGAELPHLVDHFLIAIGERFDALGFGTFRTAAAAPAERRLRRAALFSLPAAACAGARAVRHLLAPGGAGHGACGAAPLCAGALFSRGTPCAFCAGTPLLRGGKLLGLMSDDPQCGVTCEPQLYVNLAVARDWIDSVLY